ncbi:MAG: HigA family addiction module antitoxin [Nitrospinales bacterium]
MSKRWKDPIHPGEVLADELDEIGLNANELAKRLDLPHGRIYDILREERAITASTALRLGKFFGTGPELWMNLQKEYDLEVTEKKEASRLKSIKPFKMKKSTARKAMRV